ncbi:septum formation protein Maf [Nordella sp. HKS 07]|uniref:Maf family protein n=1 Tax=Nordella sp. HKS 07 TaxID=2712222 RepID=UPI0013E12F1A|nr:Maf family nucleotide pyrophosphatase [Nordella sp. HKS 07]QIG48207.1 septum formation protein Maf [Nordella sp. HKS 07]
MKLVLASTSRIRGELLAKAGLTFETIAPDVDETELKRHSHGLSPGDLAQKLAGAKAVSVANRVSGALVIGADQVLNLAGRAYDKPASAEDARRQMTELRGRRHILETALCCAQDGKIVWQTLGQATLTMRSFSDGFLEDYLVKVGGDVTTSVGGYKLEGLGAQLFEKIDGDYFTILGLPLLPLLDFLRRKGAVPV